MASKVLLPKFGQTVETGEITQWLKKEGDPVRKGDILCEIATDKSSLEVESHYDGTLLRVLLPQGVSAPVGCVMAVIGAAGEALPETFLAECRATITVVSSSPMSSQPAAPTVPRAARPVPSAPAAPVPAAAKALAPIAEERAGRVFISPRARRLATANDVPISILSGSGENGRISEVDVREYLEAVGPVSPAARTAALAKGLDLRGVKGSGASGRVMLEDVAGLAAGKVAGNGASKAGKSVRPPLPALVAKLEKPSPMRRAIAANMAASAATIPAFQLEVTVDAAAMIARREADKAAGIRIGYGDLIAKACALAIRRFPIFAATWRDDGIAYGDHVDIGFAVAVPGGLVVPAVRDCDLASVPEIAAASQALIDKARANKLAPEDYAGAVFTLSNLGSFPVDRFVAIVPPGQSGILAIGRIREELTVRGGGFFPAKLLSLTLSADHRYIDGADGARFMQEVKELLEDAAAL